MSDFHFGFILQTWKQSPLFIHVMVDLAHLRRLMEKTQAVGAAFDTKKTGL